MRWNDLLRMSISSLKRRKLRTFLTILGVVIGTASIVVMISLGLGLQESMYKEVEQSGGAKAITVTGKDNVSDYRSGSSGSDETGKYITDDSIESIRRLEYVKSAEPVYNLSVILLNGKYEGEIELYGMTEEGLKLSNLKIDKGGRLPDAKKKDLEIVFGNAVLMNLQNTATKKYYWDTGELPDIDLMSDHIFLVLDQDSYYNSKSPGSAGLNESGESVEDGRNKISPKKYAVNGCGIIEGGIESVNVDSYRAYCNIEVLKKYLKREFGSRAMPGQPVTAGGKPYKKFVYSSAKVQADNIDNVQALSDEIRSLGYQVSSNLEYIESAKKQFAMIQALLGGIGAVSLLVAAIGIANTMMMSIYERTKEIGVMKVLGCSLKNIRQLFLCEAAFIGLTGGIAGNVISLFVSAVINIIIKNNNGMISGSISLIPVWLIFLSSAFAVIVGTAAGYFPARRAMKLSALSALRNE